jgi:hypothetical protein
MQINQAVGRPVDAGRPAASLFWSLITLSRSFMQGR